MYQTIFFFAVIGGIIYAAAKQIPPESPDIIAARKRYGKVGD